MIVFSVMPGLAAGPAATEIVCNVLPDGPPKGAQAIAASPLPWAHGIRADVARGRPVKPDPAMVDAWLDVDLPYSTELQARAQVVDDWVIAELRAPTRPSVTPVNLLVVVDVSKSMSSIPTRELPLLQDAPEQFAYRPVSRLELAREAVWDLIEHLPSDAELGIVAYDGRHARVILPPSHDPLKMGSDVGQLAVGMVSPTDPSVQATLDRVSTRMFDPCGDNRVLVFTDDVGDLSNEMLLTNVARWGAGDLERWTFAVGSFEPVDANQLLLEQAPRTASWVLNAASDARRIWPMLLDAGGVSVRDVSFGPAKRMQDLGDLESSQGVSLRFPARKARSLQLKVGDETIQVEPTLSPGPSARALAEQRGVASGAASELHAWLRESEPTLEPELLAISGFLEEGAVVVELWKNERHPVDPGSLTVRAAGGAPSPVVAWHADGERLVVVAPIEGTPDGVVIEGAGLPDESWVRLRRRRVGRAWVEGAMAVREGRDYAPPTDVDDPRLLQVLAASARASGDGAGVLRWTADCLSVIHPDLLETCVMARATELMAQDRLSETLALLDAALERLPSAVQIALLDAEIAADHQEWTVAEERFLQAIEAAPFEERATRGLALVMEEQNQPSLAALAWTRHLLFHPDDRRARESLIALLDAESWRPGTRGPLSQVEKLSTDQTLYKMKLLFEDWSQAQARGRTLEAWAEDRWYRLLGPMVSRLDRDGYVRFAAIRVLVHPDDLAEHVTAGVGEVGLMLGMRR